jgi:hypothetical protein
MTNNKTHDAQQLHTKPEKTRENKRNNGQHSRRGRHTKYYHVCVGYIIYHI